MSSQALQIGNGSAANPSFVQQGQVDWVSFANSTIAASVSVMQRFSAAGVQPVTVAGGLALGSRFEVGKKGAQNMDIALKALSGSFGYDKLLYYGFGYKSFVNVLTETKVGVNLVALCACLVEMHGIEIAAGVLAALWKLEAFPENFEPAISQFNALTTACAGVVTATPFGQIGDVMLGDLRKLTLGKSATTRMPIGSISNTDDIAKALYGLFQISRGTLKYIDVIGGANCSFIGAFAHWLLDLTVHVEDVSGAIIFQNTSNRETAQVRIQYCSLDRVSTDLHIASTTYILGDHNKMLVHTPFEDKFSLLIRIPWDGCLERVFWSSIQRLKSVSRILGQFLGSAARIYAALATGEADVGDFSRDDFSDFVVSTYGHGFVKSVEKVFPELGRVSDIGPAMLEASNSSFKQALSDLQVAIHSLTRLCECSMCKELTSRRNADEQDALEDTNCILATTVTITLLVRLVAGLATNDTINPTITGLQQLHRRHLQRLEYGWRRNGSLPTTQDALGLLTVGDTSDKPHSTITPAYLMADLQCLFTGYQPTKNELFLNNYRTAFSYNGICFYLEALRGLSSNAAVLRCIHVIPGRIQRGDREYNAVWDSAPAPQPELPKATLGLKNVALPSELRNDKIEIKALVTELSGEGQLIFYYQATLQGLPVRIRPGVLTQRVLKRSGLITCDKRTCNRDLVVPCSIILEGWDIGEHRKKGVLSSDPLIWPFREDDIGRCVVIETVPAGGGAFYIRQGECLPCCTKTISNDSSAMII
jgi:hypothetical protein